MQISEVPEQPLVELDDKTLLALSRHWGKVGQVALRRFLATLPEIARRCLYRRARCHSIHEYASKYANASKEVVDTVFLVHKRIGTFEVLWGLFAQGKTGLTVFRRISSHVKAENAAWWAQVVQTCTLREIERILKGLEGPAKPGEGAGQILLSPSPKGDGISHASPATLAIQGQDRGQAATALPEEIVGPLPIERQPVPPETPADRAFNAAQEEQERVSEGRVPEERVSEVRIPEGRVSEEWVPEGRVPEGRLPGKDPAQAAVSPEAAAAVAADSPATAGSGLTAAPEAATGVSALASQIAQNLVAEYRRRGMTVSEAEVIEAALKHVATQGVLPAIGGQEPCPAEGDASSKPKRTRLPRVLVSLSEIGLTFLRTIGGFIPLTQKEAEAFDSGRPPVAYPMLVARAEAAGQKAAGRAIPAAVKLAIWIRAAGRCETRGCNNLIDEFDHLDPYSETLVHFPGRMAGVCDACHRARHNGLVANPQDPPGEWRFIHVGHPRRSSAVDRQVQARRQAARHATLLPPTAG